MRTSSPLHLLPSVAGHALLHLLLPTTATGYTPPTSVPTALTVTESSSAMTYIFGPESSGTRFLSRTIAATTASTSISWDGENPACWSERVQHISLPWGQTCADHVGEADVIIPEVDLCSKSVSGRWFANVTGTLLAHATSRAVAIVRDLEYTLPSVIAHHCSDAEVATRQNELARQLIEEAVEAVPDRILLVDYETLSVDGRSEWMRVFSYLGIDANNATLDEAVAAWIDGDGKYETSSANSTARVRMAAPAAPVRRSDGVVDLQALRLRRIA